MRNVSLTPMFAILGFAALFYIVARVSKSEVEKIRQLESIPEGYKTNLLFGVTNGVATLTIRQKGTNFLTLTNLVYLQTGESVIMNLGDDEWRILTNRYQIKLVTNTVFFYDEGK